MILNRINWHSGPSSTPSNLPNTAELPKVANPLPIQSLRPLLSIVLDALVGSPDLYTATIPDTSLL